MGMCEFDPSQVRGPVLHIDETEVKLKDGSGYIWVFAMNPRLSTFSGAHVKGISCERCSRTSKA